VLTLILFIQIKFVHVFLKWDGVNMLQLGILVTSACNIFKSCFFKDVVEILKLSKGSMQIPSPCFGTYILNKTKKEDKFIMLPCN
jgi:hypothetical protein